jgi:hypothetical protein
MGSLMGFYTDQYGDVLAVEPCQSHHGGLALAIRDRDGSVASVCVPLVTLQATLDQAHAASKVVAS